MDFSRSSESGTNSNQIPSSSSNRGSSMVAITSSGIITEETSITKSTGTITEESLSTGSTETISELTANTESTRTNTAQTTETSTEQITVAATMTNAGMRISSNNAKLTLVFESVMLSKLVTQDDVISSTIERRKASRPSCVLSESGVDFLHRLLVHTKVHIN
ncbi:unnamed protein product, partial [Didymodactylos carnosus]